MFTRVKMRTRHCIRVAGLLVWCGVLSCMSCTGSVTALSALLSKRAEGGRCEPGGDGGSACRCLRGHFRVCTFPLSTSVLVRGQGKVQSC